MSALVPQILETLTTYPGNLTYHLVLAFAITGALYAAYVHWRNSSFPQGRPMVIGLAVLLGLRLLGFLASGLAWQQAISPDQFLPPLARLTASLGLLVIVWLWAFPEPSPRSNLAAGLLALLILTFFILAYLTWQNTLLALESAGLEGPLYYNRYFQLRPAWELLAAGLALLGIILLGIRRPNHWGIGLGMLFILLLGHGIEFFYPNYESHYNGMVRLAELAAYPLLLTLPNRFPLPGITRSTGETQAQPLQVIRRSYSAESETFRAFLALTMEQDPSKICAAFTRTVSHILLADVCLLLTLDEARGELIFECGYDLIREQPFDGTAFDQSVMPVLYAAMKRSRTLKLPASSTSPDLQALAHALNLDRVGHLLAVPIPQENSFPKNGVVLLSPYSYRAWTYDDEAYLVEAAEALVQIARKNQNQAIQSQQLRESLANLEQMQIDLDALRQENENLRQERMADNSYDPETAQSLAELLEAYEEAQETINQLQSQLATVQASEPATMRAMVGQEADADQLKAIASIVQDLQGPMASILSYTDLLLSETTGILGNLQIKFLERVKASVERMRAMVDELLQLAGRAGADQALAPQPVRLSDVIDDVLAFTRGQLREKQITLRVDLPDQLPDLQANRDALQQILIHLLQNAGTVTPMEGEIALRASLEENGKEPHILLQVSDSGGGIPEQDLPHVFSRIRHAERARIQGVGDAGVGLALAKSLVEAQNGQIWVDSDIGNGATFSIRLPTIQRESPDESPGGPPP